MKLDWSPSERDTPGVKYLTVASAIEKTSSKGDPMIELKLSNGDGAFYYDYLPLGGNGRNLGLRKLEAFGVKKGTEDFDARELIGTKCWAMMIAKEFPAGSGNMRLQVDASIKDEGWTAGYRLDAPPGWSKDEVDVPF